MIRIMEISFFLKYKKCQAVHFCNTVPLKLVHPSHLKKKVLPLLSRNITEPLITHFTLRPCHKLQVNKWQGLQLHGIFSVNQPYSQSHLVQSQVVLVLQNAPKKLKHRRYQYKWIKKKVQACCWKTTWRSVWKRWTDFLNVRVGCADDSLTFEPSIIPFGVDGPTYPSYLAFLCRTPYNWCLYHY